MTVGPYRFSPPWWGTGVFVLVAALLCSLGVWQIERAQMKKQLVAAQNIARTAAPQPMRLPRAAASGMARDPRLYYGRHYIVAGRVDGKRQILLDNQSNGTQIGYRVWTPVILDSGVRVIVDRGWIPLADQSRKQVPDPRAPSGRVTMTGLWRSFPQPGLRFGESASCDAASWPRRLNYPDAATVRCQYPGATANGLLLLNPEDAHGFVRDWQLNLTGISPFHHYAYASQWFLMAFVCGVIFVVVNSKRRE